MNKFIGRKKELASLTELYHTPGFQMSVIYGRRRVGKSTLIKEFITDKKAVYFTATKAGIRKNVELLGKSVLETLAPGMSEMSFKSLDDLLTFIGVRCTQERIVVVIDELPYFAETDRGVLSVLQNHIDNEWLSGQMFLILCGSSMSFMEQEVLGGKSPVFGRRTSQLKLEPFSYLEAAEFVPGYTWEEKAVCYGVTGGIAKYLSLFDDRRSLDDNIIRQFFEKSGYLYEEPNNLLVQEFRNVSAYNDIIGAIASGANRVNEIADKTHADSSMIIHGLANLMAIGIVDKEYAITDETNKRKVQYNLKDGMFQFWHQFVPDGMGAVELGKGSIYYENMVKPKIPQYMGKIFESMCRYYTLNAGLEGQLNCFVTAIGRWWGTNPDKKEQTDIDVVGLDRGSKRAVLGECKFRNEPVDKKVYEELLDRNGLISNKYTTVQYLLFSKSGFSDWLLTNVDQTFVKMISLEEMYQVFREPGL